MKRFILAILGIVLLSLGSDSLKVSEKWTNPRLFDGTVLEATYTPTPIKSIQQGLVSIASGSLTQPQAVTAVVTTAAAVQGQIISANLNSGTLSAGDLCRVTVTSSTQLTTTREALLGAASNDAGCSFTYTLVEFLPQFIKSVQSNVTTVASTSATAALSPSVVVAKSMCFYGGMSQAAGGIPPGQGYSGCYVSATNTVTLKSGVTTSVNVAWTVLEFK